MKKSIAKTIIACSFFAFASASLFAYNPPFAGEDIYRITSPELLSGGGSATGGPAFTIVPASITYNPSLTAVEQRSIINASLSLMLDGDSYEDTHHGFGFQIGGVIPTRWAVIAGTLQGVFDDNTRFDLGHSFIAHIGAAKDVTDRLYVGANLYTGFYTGHGSDFTVGVDLGILYQLDDISFLKKPRVGLALLNLGKPLSGSYSVYGIDGSTSGVSYPGIITPRASFASDLLEIRDFALAFSADLAFPTFQNVLFDTALGFSYKDFVTLDFGWNCNIRELVAGGKVNLPSIGINFKFAISTASEKVKDSWKKSEIVPSVAWQNMNGGIHVVSAGASLYLGMQDKEAPTILLWDEVKYSTLENTEN